MANYSVDIALAVKGSEKAAQEIKKLEKAINDIQRKAAVDLGGQVRLQGEQRLLREKIKNFQISRRELKNSQEIARLTNERIKGLGQYANTIGPQEDRIAQLRKRAAQEQIQAQQRYNKLVDETLAKLSRIAEINRKASQYSSPIGPPRGGVTQYPGPIGPGAASQANVPQGPFSRLVDRPRRRAGAGGPGGGLAAGIGFPLLFGSGPASALGGAGGTAFGFGGQILGSALGGQLDQLQERANNLAKALRGVGSIFNALEATVGGVDDETKRYIQNLENSGQKTKAAALAADVLAEKIGVKNAEAFINAGQAADGASEALKNVGTVLVSLSERLRRAGENPTGLTPNGVLDLLPPQFRPAPPTPIEDTPEFKNRTTDLKTALDLEKLLTAEKKAQGGVDEEAIALASEAVVRKQAQIEKDLIARDLKDNKIDKEQQALKIAAVQERLDQRLLDIAEKRVNAAERKRKEDEDAARRAERERMQRERALQQEEKQRRTQYESAVIANANQANLLMEVQQQRTALEEGESAALQQRLEDLETIVANQRTVLDIKYEAAYADAKSLEEQQAIFQTYTNQVNVLRNRFFIEKEAIAQAQSRIQLEKELLNLQQQQALRGIETGIRRQIEDANLRPTGNKAQDEQLQLRIDQIRRQKDAELELTDAIKAQERIRDSVTSDENIRKAVDEIGRLEKRLALTKELLPQLDAAEQAQLRFNQALEAVQPITDTVVNGLFTAISAVAEGTKTAEQAFADFLKNIGDMLIQAAAQQIATYIAIGIARAFAGMGSKGGDAINESSLSSIRSYSGVGANTRVELAEGGYVTGPTNAVVGEGGEPEYIIPQSKMRESMERYSRGTRGSAVIPAAGDSGASGASGGVAVAAPIDVRFNVERINNVDYVTAAEFQEGMQQAAKQGAQRGEQQAIKRLQMSSSTRKRIGL